MPTSFPLWRPVIIESATNRRRRLACETASSAVSARSSRRPPSTQPRPLAERGPSFQPNGHEIAASHRGRNWHSFVQRERNKRHRRRACNESPAFASIISETCRWQFLKSPSAVQKSMIDFSRDASECPHGRRKLRPRVSDKVHVVAMGQPAQQADAWAMRVTLRSRLSMIRILIVTHDLECRWQVAVHHEN